MADAQGEEHAAERLRLRLHELVDDLRGDGRTHGDGVARAHAAALVVLEIGAARVEPGEIVGRELVEVRHVVHEPRLDELVDELVAHTVDVHAPAAHPMREPLLHLRGAVDGDAAVRDLALLVHHGAAARGARPGHAPLRGVGGALREHRPHDLGDHVTRLVHHDGIAHAHVLAVHLVLVVQRRARDGGARDRHRVEFRDRREHARAAHLDADLAQDGLLLLRRELERDRPARGARGEAELVLLGEAVDFTTTPSMS